MCASVAARRAAVVGARRRLVARAVRRQPRRRGVRRTAARLPPGTGAVHARPPASAPGGTRLAVREPGALTVRPRAQRAQLRDAADHLRPRPRGRARHPPARDRRTASRCGPASATRRASSARRARSRPTRRHRLPALAGRPERRARRMDRQGPPTGAASCAPRCKSRRPVPAARSRCASRGRANDVVAGAALGVMFVAWERGGVVEARVKLSGRALGSACSVSGRAGRSRPRSRSSDQAGGPTSRGLPRAPSRRVRAGGRPPGAELSLPHGADARHDRRTRLRPRPHALALVAIPDRAALLAWTGWDGAHWRVPRRGDRRRRALRPLRSASRRPGRTRCSATPLRHRSALRCPAVRRCSSGAASTRSARWATTCRPAIRAARRPVRPARGRQRPRPRPPSRRRVRLQRRIAGRRCGRSASARTARACR